MRKAITCAIALWIGSNTLALGDVWVVDPTGGGDFASIQLAVDAALDGDTIFIRDDPDPAFRYGPFDVIGKGLVILAEEGTSVRTKSVSIQSLPQDSTVVIANLEIEGVEAPQAALSLNDNAGVVLVQGCTVTGLDTPQYLGAGPAAIHANGCAMLVLTDTVAIGADGDSIEFDDGMTGGPGLLAEESDVAAYGSELVGGNGGGASVVWSPQVVGGRGGHGALLLDSGLWASASSFRGGYGGDSCSAPLDDISGDGGNGLHAGALANAWLRACVTVAGSSGSACGFVGSSGSPTLGTIVALGNGPWNLTAPGTVREGDLIALGLAGEVGDQSFVAIRRELGASSFASPQQGWLHVRPTFSQGFVLNLGVVPSSGTATVIRPAPPLPPDSLQVFFMQSAFRSSGGALRLGPVRVLAVLDASL
jgi:hypothetical protein